MSGILITTGKVLPEWIDVNDHMNVAFYLLAFDRGVDVLWEQLGITSDYMETKKCSTFAVEAHVTYQRELLVDDPYVVTSQILAYDEKRIHQFQRMYHADKNHLVATGEWMNLHVDLESRRVTPWPPEILFGLAEFTERQGVLPMPAEAGSRMAIRKPIFAGTRS